MTPTERSLTHPDPDTTDPSTAGTSPTDPDAVELSLPARVEHLRLARLTASGVAGTLGFTIDEIEDLRLAVDELCAFLIQHAADGGRLRLTYHDVGGALLIDGRCPANGSPIELDEVARTVLESTVDRFDVLGEGDRLSFRIQKRGSVDLT